MSKPTEYRPDIDGLRAIAVVSVVLFHGGHVPSGGFAGVDMFFVISGFLITRIIAKQVQTRQFSLARFYEKRARRILPALAVVLAATTVAGVVLALPAQLAFIGDSTLATVTFSANVLFWKSSGYFSPSTDLMPLLHIWSLSVEEQFYLLFPFVLMVAARLGWSARAVLAVGTPLLFLAGLYLSYQYASVAFYLLPARAWELAIGGMLGVGVFPPVVSRVAREGMAAIGLAALSVGLIIIDPQSVWPGYLALLPCVGTALVIAAHGEEPTVVARLLSARPMVAIGLISYSLYLWHWPVFVFLRMHSAELHLPMTLAVGGMALSFVLAYASWRWVEQPFRDVEAVSPRRVAKLSVASTLVLAVVGVVLHVGEGFPQRLTPASREALAASQDIDPQRETCPSRARDNFGEWGDACAFGREDANLAEATYVVWGDSHAAAMRPAIERALPGQVGAVWWRGGCPPLLGTMVVPNPNSPDCMESTRLFFERLPSLTNVDTVFVVGRWLPAATGIRGEIGGSYRTYLVDDENDQLTEESRFPAFRRGVARSVAALRAAGKRVVIMGGVPEPGYDVPTVLALASHNGATRPGVPVRAHVAADYAEIDEYLGSFAPSDPDVTFIPVWPSLCDPECALSAEGIALFGDHDHLTASGARDFLGPRLSQLFGEHLAPR